MKKEKISSLSLPCLRGRMGIHFFYSTLMSLKDVSERIKLPEEIDKKYESEELKLGDWIQRKIDWGRIEHIVQYLKKQPQHFFNSIIVGIYDGSPQWQDINVKNSELNETLDESSIEYFSRTFGILTLGGTESLFAIDGQHRAVSIRKAVSQAEELADEEVSVIFIAHQTTDEGKVMTRRLFSTLNKYAKPVSPSEIIALSEDNNCSIITRELIENFELFKGRVLVNKNRSIRNENVTAFTNIMVLYDLVERVLTNKKVYGMPVKGHDKNEYITNRVSDEQLKLDMAKCQKVFNDVLLSIPSVARFFKNGKVDRKLPATNLVFRPIGQNVVFDVYKVAVEHNKGSKAVEFFKRDDFNLKNKNWKKVFWNDETGTIIPDKANQKFATLLILESIGVKIKRTKKDEEILANYKIKLV